MIVFLVPKSFQDFQEMGPRLSETRKIGIEPVDKV